MKQISRKEETKFSRMLLILCIGGVVLLFSWRSALQQDDIHSISFLVLGDFGVDGADPKFANNLVASKLVLHAMQTNSRPQAIFISGDVVYPRGLFENKSDLHRLDEVLQRFPQSLQTVDKYVTVGNHDCEGSMLPLTDYSNQNSHWKLNKQIYHEYTFPLLDSRVLRLIVLNTCTLVCSKPGTFLGKEIDARCGDGMEKYLLPSEQKKRIKQLDWLKNLKPADASNEYVVVLGHWPMYSFRGNGPSRILVKEVLPILRDKKFDLYISGHDHSLQMLKTAANLGNPLFVVCGAGGYPLHDELKKEADGSVNEEDDVEIVNIQDREGFVRLKFTMDHKALIEFFDLNGDITYSHAQDLPVPPPSNI